MPPKGKSTAVLAFWQAVIVAIITSLTTYLVARTGKDPKPTNTVPPPSQVITVKAFAPESDDAFVLLRDMSIFDLRSWKEVPKESVQTRYSPVNYINYLHVKKVKPSQKYFAHYATSGYAIDLRCITQPAAVLVRETPNEHPGEKEYAIEIDVSDIALNVEFLIVIEATYWNSFQNLGKESASTYTDKDISQQGELGLIVLFPDQKPFNGYSLTCHPNESENEESYTSPHSLYADKSGKFIYWSIITRHSDYHYKLHWNW